MIPLRKYSYPYLGQLKFSSGAFILLVDVTSSEVNRWQIQLNGYDLESSCLTADNAYQSKHQALRSKERPVVLRNRFVSSHTSGEEFRKKFCFIEGSQKHVVSVTLNGRCLKQPGLFLELDICSNWATDGDGLWLVWWPRTWWSL